METTFATRTMSLNKVEGKATLKSLDDALRHMAELIADNDLPRDDESIVDLEHARQLMKRAYNIINQYGILF